jgi:hypothetical protein
MIFPFFPSPGLPDLLPCGLRRHGRLCARRPAEYGAPDGGGAQRSAAWGSDGAGARQRSGQGDLGMIRWEDGNEVVPSGYLT